MMYRSLLTVLLFAAATCAIDSVGFAQDDPFGGDDPVANPPVVPQPGKDRTNQRFAAVLAKAKAALAKGHKPTDVREFEKSELEWKINRSLDDETAIEAVQTPLVDVCQTISRMHDIPILVNDRALEEIGLTADTPVNIQLKGVKLRSLLRLMLRQYDLTYQIADEVLQITTIEAAEHNLKCEMFKLPKNLAANKNDIVQAVTTNVVPGTWETLGGPSTIMLIDDVLVVSATDDVMHRVGQLLNKLSEKIGK